MDKGAGTLLYELYKYVIVFIRNAANLKHILIKSPKFRNWNKNFYFGGKCPLTLSFAAVLGAFIERGKVSKNFYHCCQSFFPPFFLSNFIWQVLYTAFDLLIQILCKIKRGTVSQDFLPTVFFHQIIPPGPLIHGLKPF
jgi:hypothetical protein